MPRVDLYDAVERHQGVIVAWIRANGLDPDRVPWWSVPIVDLTHLESDHATVTVALYRESPTGGSRFIDPRTDLPAMEAVTVPLVVFPPRELLPWLHGQWREEEADG